MKNYILTGTPGAGKTAIVLWLERQGHYIVPEAATDVCALEQALGVNEPWTSQDFIAKVTKLQLLREQRCLHLPSLQGDLKSFQLKPIFLDRSLVCTFALAKYLGLEIADILKNAIDESLRNKTYQNKVFFIKNRGFVQKTDVRKISFEEALKFEEIHKETYKKFGFELVYVEDDELVKRGEEILKCVTAELLT